MSIARRTRWSLFLALATAVSAYAPFGCGGSDTAGDVRNDGGVDAGTDARGPGVPRDIDGGDAGLGGPERLSETGLYSDVGSKKIAADVIPFAPAHPLWADGATKDRYILLPKGTKVDTSDMDAWTFPVGTKAWKEFRQDGKVVETRFLWKKSAGFGETAWFHVSYEWLPDASDAVARPLGALGVLGTSHDIPSQEDCTACHGKVNDFVIGFSALELSAPSPSDGGAADAGPGEGRLMTFAAQGLFTSAPAGDFAVPGDGIVRDALAYMHGNCGFCHNYGGKLQSQSAMRLRLLTSQKSPDDTGAYRAIGLKMRHVSEGNVDTAFVAGKPEKSQAYLRMLDTGLVRMPPKATKVIDTVGSGLVREWILALPP